MRHTGSAAALALVVVLVFPMAAALPGAVDVRSASPVVLHDATAAFSPSAFFSAGPAWQAATLLCDAMQVTVFSTKAGRAGNLEVPVQRTAAHYPLTRASVEFQEVQADAWLAAYPHPDLWLSAATTPLATLHPERSPVLGNARSTPEPEPQPDQPSYGLRAEGEVLRIESTAPLAMEGRLMLKFSGSLLRIAAAENTSTLDTRSTPDDPAMRERRWAFIECAEGVLRSAGGVAFEATATSIEPLTAGYLETVADQAFVDTQADSSAASGEFFARGNLSGRAVAYSGANSNGVRLTVQGEIATTSVGVPQAPVQRFWPLAAAVGVAVVVGGATLYVRRRAPRQLTLEQCVDLADQNAELQRFSTAVEWIDQAIAIAGPQPRLLVDRAYYLAESGDVEGASAAYEAAVLSGSVEARLLFARFLCQLDLDGDRAASYLVSALDAAPLHVLEIEDDPGFAELRLRPEVRAAMRRAHARL